MFRHDALAKGRYRRVPARWDTEFGRWVSGVGIPRIVAALAHDPGSHSSPTSRLAAGYVITRHQVVFAMESQETQ